MNNSIRFWRLQEVEIPLMEGKTLQDVKEAIEGEDNFLFDYDLFDWNKEIVINEDCSGADECFAIKIDDEVKEINDYSLGNCKTFNFVEKSVRDWNKILIKYLDETIFKLKNNGN